MTTLTQTEIQDRIPHRYENLLLDECLVPTEDNSKFSIQLNDNDALGRDIFLADHLNDRALPTPYLLKLQHWLALLVQERLNPAPLLTLQPLLIFPLKMAR